MPFAKPAPDTQLHGILRDIWARKGPLVNEAEHYPLPLLGKPLKSSIHPCARTSRSSLGAEGPKNIALAAELCDGWLAMLFSPGQSYFTDALAEGFAKPGARRSAEDFEVADMPLQDRRR